jgi:16S rRNA processing protein RimM
VPDGSPDDLIELGRIAGAHGIKGWIKVQPFSSDSQALGATKRWWLVAPAPKLPSSRNEDNSSAKPIDLAWAKPHGAQWMASIKGCNDRNAAEALKGHTISVSRADFPRLDADEFYWVDLIGCEAISDDSGELVPLGVVESIQDSPAHPILVIRQQIVDDTGQRVDQLDAHDKPVYSLVPFVQAHVGEVDLVARTMVVHWPSDF